MVGSLFQYSIRSVVKNTSEKENSPIKAVLNLKINTSHPDTSFTWWDVHEADTLYTDQKEKDLNWRKYSFTDWSTIRLAEAPAATGQCQWRKRPLEPYWVYHDMIQAGERHPHTDLHTQAHSLWSEHLHTEIKLLERMLAHTYACVHTRTHVDVLLSVSRQIGSPMWCAEKWASSSWSLYLKNKKASSGLK